MTSEVLSPLYPIVDARLLAARGTPLAPFAAELRAAGVTLLQYRDKSGSPQAIVDAAAVLREAFAGTPARLILNDRPDLAVLAEFSGVHVGQTDLSPADARRVLQSVESLPAPQRGDEGVLPTLNAVTGKNPRISLLPPPSSPIVGVSTHTDAQVRLADTTPADYIAIGPIFATGTKPDAEPVVGLEGVRRARALTAKPLVAIGGITRANARSVIDAGADSVAVISALFAPGESAESIARDFLRLLA